MFAIDEALALGASNPGFATPLTALPILAAGYLRYVISARRRGLNFHLRKLESIELNRSLLLYKKVSDRLCELGNKSEGLQQPWLARYQQRKTLRRKFAPEREDLEQYAAHLRAEFLRLRGKPLLRFKSWRHVISAQFALGHSLLLFCAVCMAALLVFFCIEERLLPDMLNVDLDSLPFWNRMPSAFYYANWIAAVCMLPAMPALYVYRRAKPQGAHGANFRAFREFAVADPDTLIAQLRLDRGRNQERGREPERADEPKTCFDVLGVASSATIEQIKEAYKLQVKQNHPDRVQGMSPLFRELAEEETKKLNIAYEQALLALRSQERMAAPSMA